MVQHIQDSKAMRLERPLNMHLIELEKLREHEEVDLNHLWKLEEEIELDGCLKLAIAVDRKTNIILDGEHRFNALKHLGCKRIPVIFLDYNSGDIEVEAWRNGEKLTKNDVIQAGLSEDKLPPMTTKHMVKVYNKLMHISAIEKRVNIPLEILRGTINGCG